MWSGPRNLSTALMYAFAMRADTRVVDEPFYAAWLRATGMDHPMRDAVLAALPSDPGQIAAACATDPVGSHLYQKHMVQHMEPSFDRGFMAGAANVMLIRHPLRVIASYHAKRERPSLSDIGATRHLEIWEEARAHGPVPVISAETIRANPARALARLCSEIGLTWDPKMLAWPTGGHPADGPWAPHWYGAVHCSTGFAGPEGPLPKLPKDLAQIADAAMPAYETLRSVALNTE